MSRSRSGLAGSWRVALRIARRSARRNAARSLLVLLMLFLPAYAGSVLAVSWGNLSGISAQEADFQLGKADLLVGADNLDPVVAALPSGSHAATLLTGTTIVRGQFGLDVYDYEAINIADRLAQGRYVVRAGRGPQAGTEIALTTAMATALDAGIGEVVEVGLPLRQARIVGIVDISRSLRQRSIIAAADSPLSRSARAEVLVGLPPGAAGWAPSQGSVSGLQLRKRADLRPDAREVAIQAAAMTVVAGFAGMQMVLLVGAAFVVGARRQRRELLLVAAVGGTDRQVGRIVLAGGLLFGVLAAGFGVLAGLVTFWLAGPTIEQVANHPLIDVSIQPLPLVGVALGVIAIAVLAAYLPARSVGRTALRREAAAARPRSDVDLRWLRGGLACLVVATAVLWYSANPNGRAELIAAGGMLLLLGIVAVTPAVVRRAGLITAGALPLSGRLATRHAARHYLRTASAVAAVTAAMAGSVALTFVATADEQSPPGRQEARPGQVLLPPEATDVLGSNGLRQLAAALPARDVVTLQTVTGSAHGRIFVQSAPAADGVIDGTRLAAMEQRGIAVGEAEVIQLVTGREATPSELDVLRRGGAVVFNDTLATGDHVTLSSADGTGQTLPMALAQRHTYFTGLPGLVVAGATRDRLGLTTTTSAVIIDTTRAPTDAELRTARDVMLAAQLQAEHGPDAPILLSVAGVRPSTDARLSTMFYVLATVSAIITLSAGLVAVGLAQSEMRGDLAIMVAVGAAPKVSRRIRITQAALVVGLAAPLSLLAGIGPAAGYIAYNADLRWHVPWLSLLVVLTAPGLLATVLAATFNTGTDLRVRTAR